MAGEQVDNSFLTAVSLKTAVAATEGALSDENELVA